MYVQAGFLSNDKRNGTRLRDRASVLAGSVGNLGVSLDHSSDEESNNKTSTLPQGKILHQMNGHFLTNMYTLSEKFTVSCRNYFRMMIF